MKKNIFKTTLMTMVMVVICNVAFAASMNDMTKTTDATLCMAASEAKYENTPHESSMGEEFLVNASTTERVKAQFTDRYTHFFYADETVLIGVKGDGDTDLDLYVYDDKGNLIDSDTDPGDECLCIFTPKRAGRYTIKVKNLGRIYNQYRIRFVQ